MRTRVLHVVPDLMPYGLENIVAYLACQADYRRFAPAVLSLYDASAGGLEDLLARHGVPVFHLNKRRGLDWRMFARVSKVLRQFRPHVLHTHNYVLRYTYPAALWQRVPVQVHTVHNVAQREVDRVGRAMQQIAFRRGVVPVAIADEVAASIRRVYGIAGSALIPNGIAVRDYQAGQLRGKQWREREGFGADEILCLSVGRLAPQKDHATLLEAFAAGPAKNPRARLLLAGEGRLRSDLERQTAALGLSGSVRFLGRRTDIPDALSAADLFVMASRWEGNPLSVMEAMSAGVPVVATTVGGVPELVQDGRTGLLVPPGEPAALASAMCRLLDDGGLRASIGRNAARWAEERFDAGVMVRAYERLYEELLHRTGSGTGSLAASRACKATVDPAARLPVSRKALMKSDEWRGRIFVLSTDLVGGGAEAQAISLATELKSRGWEIDMASMVEAAPCPAPLIQAGIEMHSLHMKRGRPDPRVIPPLVARLRAWRPDILHSHMCHANLLARAIRRASPVRALICTLHNVNMSGVHHDHGWFLEAMHRWTDPLADMTTAICQCAADECVRAKAVPQRKMRVMLNGIDMSIFRPSAEARARVRRDLGMEEKFVWLAAGRLEFQKDYGNMLRAFATLTGEERARTVLLISGTGSLQAQMIRLAEELRISGDVRFLGRRSDMPDVLNAADAFVMSSAFEGSPMALLEAAATCLPIVSTAVGGIPEIVLDGRSGFLSEPRNPQALGEQMRRMMSLPGEERRAMGWAGKAHVERHHRLETVVDRWEDLYREMLLQAGGLPA